MKGSPIIIYTDGSCNPEYKIGAWAVVLFVEDEKIVLSGTAEQTTHQRMELTAVIRAFECDRACRWHKSLAIGAS